jgi:hypothetical protein
MIEIKNKMRSPVQLVVRSRTSPRAFTTLAIPGIGKNKNVYLLEDEMTTEYVERAEKSGLISIRHIPNREYKKGE